MPCHVSAFQQAGEGWSCKANEPPRSGNSGPATTTLRDWAAGTMDRDYPALRAPNYGPGASGELLRGGRVALFPDSLDECPKTRGRGTAGAVSGSPDDSVAVMAFTVGVRWHGEQLSRRDALGDAPRVQHRRLLT
jgi:hypothetical protein